MPVTKTDILNQFKTIYEGKTHVTYTFDKDGNNGNIKKTQKTEKNVMTDETKAIVESLIDAILLQIKAKGVDIGDSLATKLEVK